MLAATPTQQPRLGNDVAMVRCFLPALVSTKYEAVLSTTMETARLPLFSSSRSPGRRRKNDEQLPYGAGGGSRLRLVGRTVQ